MTVVLRIKKKEGRKILNEVIVRCIKFTRGYEAPFHFRGKNTFVILSSIMEESIFEWIVEKAGDKFFDYFEIVEGRVEVGGPLNGRIVPARKYVEEKLKELGYVKKRRTRRKKRS